MVAAAYTTPGVLPNATDGVVQKWVCFDDGFGQTCDYSVVVHVVYCPARVDEAADATKAGEEQGFYLFRLPEAPNCDCGYCTAAPAPPSAATAK